jgi:Ser/Thr protein kinase RdoA (MazF antagonist)
MDDPRLQLVNLQGVRTLAATPAEEALVDRCIARVRILRRTYGREVYDRLTGYVIHGDYTPANVVYSSAGEVVGVFDFDWAMPGARCLDVAYGLCFFATAPRQIDAGSIWSLTDAATFTVERCATFLSAYHSAWPLSVPEREAIPHAFAGLWLSKRLEGMAKVERDERFRFFARDIEGPLCWMDAHWAEVERSAFGASLA